MKKKNITQRKRIHWRVRQKVEGSPVRPRLSVYRSNKEIYCQLIDDLRGITLAAASSIEDGISDDISKTDKSKEVGKLIARRAIEKNIGRVVFDRSGYLYHGRVKAVAEGAREEGLKF